jgi:hypothetical protein
MCDGFTRGNRFFELRPHDGESQLKLRLAQVAASRSDPHYKNRTALEEKRKRVHFFRENRRGCNDWARREHSEGFCIRPNACKVRANCPPQARPKPVRGLKSAAGELPVDSPPHGL